MLRKELIVGIFAAFTILILFGTALAEDSNDKSILGTDEFTFDAPETKADVASRNYVYDKEPLALVGTEAGSEVTSIPQAQQAARNYVYDEERLAAVGTEAGDWKFRVDDQGSGTSEVIADKRDATCSKC
jgi:hypothetical protein